MTIKVNLFLLLQVEESKLPCFSKVPLSKVVGNTQWVKIGCKNFLTPPTHSLCLPEGQCSLWGQQRKGLLIFRGQSICWGRVVGWRQRHSQLSLVIHPASVSPRAASLPGAAYIGALERSRHWEWWHCGSLCCAAYPLMPECRRVKWKLRPSCLFLLSRLSTPLKSSFNQWRWLIFSLAPLHCANSLSPGLLNTGFLNTMFC